MEKNITQLYNEIESAIKAAKFQGLTLVHGTWGSYKSKLVCPLSAFNPEKIKSFQDASKQLNLSENWVESFVNGFDGHGPGKKTVWEAYWCGKHLREKHNPPAYYDVYFDPKL
jgi:hypothetical protein